ncbi:sigma-70 family RNA polymerase sigma factor [Skermania sp. ID1734]|uniref:ECF RNA polymerase sigma factor SigK n=1 Tax=Skermania sp. ID1734 TaxID=2597516 RepID=UPI00117D6D2D|nr:ECF RNA polymerase sigma factor SigK [Skermania sp. ID1734]TSE02082.1 sigma-70 family RNA polymerase sigma factor [Skermania sp. ID1734]
MSGPQGPDANDACGSELGRLQSARASEAAALADLLVRSAAGDQHAFAELYDRTSARIYGLVLRIVRDGGFAEETTQEVYLQVWRNAEAFDQSKGSALSWLLTFAHRRAVDRVRAEQSNSVREVVYEASNYRGEFDQVSDEVDRRFERQAVLDCLETLTETQRQAIEMAYYGGRTYREVADDLNAALPTVKSRIRDGLARLRGCLGVS